MRLGFSNLGVESTGPHSNGRVDWLLIRGARENKQNIFILYQNCFFLVPKRQVRTGDLSAIRSILRANLPGKTQLLET